MSLINIGLIFVAGLDLGLAILILLLNPKNKINIYLALTVLFLSSWTFGMAMFRNASSEHWALIWTWMQNGSGSLIVVALFFLSAYFPYQSVVLKKWQIALIGLSIIMMMAVVVIPGAWVKKIILNSPDNEYELSRFGLIYFNLHFFFYLFASFRNFIKKYRANQGFIRKQLSYFLISAGIIAIFGSIFAAFIPLVLGELGPYWIGPFFAVPTVLILLRFIYKSNA